MKREKKSENKTIFRDIKRNPDIGKDEVPGSNPGNSSRITPEIFGFWVFSFTFCNFLVRYDFAGFC